MRSKLLSILFWSVISAAFIGPGTVTTAAAAGAGFQLQLLWALIFSTIACIILQEASARVSISTGSSFGEALSKAFPNQKFIQWLLFIAILTGGAAYQAGNILGAIAGLKLEWSISPVLGTILLTLIASTLLWFGKIRLVANTLGLVVAVMGLAFLLMASAVPFTLREFMDGMAFSIPSNSELLIVGLIGTTIVPYNLFLASGLSSNQSISQMRWGLIPAIAIGGIISIAIMIVGSSIIGEFSFEALSKTLQNTSGYRAGPLLGIGLFAAGFTSSITAPLATAITAKTLFGKSWNENSIPYRLSWGIVMCSGLIFGISGIKPIPVIILAQAFNGLLLPGITLFLILVLNHPRIVRVQNTAINNFLLLIILAVTLFLGLNNLIKLFVINPGANYFISLGIISLLLTLLVLLGIRRFQNV